VLGLILVNFMDGDGSVDDRWLNGLFLNDWLDGLDIGLAYVDHVNMCADDQLTSWTWWWTCSPAMTGATE